MAGRKNVFGICDVCGYRYKLNQLKKNSYGMMVCQTDYDGQYDLKNHPQNRNVRLQDEETIKNPRPDEGDVYVPVTVTDWLPN